MSRFSEMSLSRREWLRLSATGVLGGSLSGWLERLAAAGAGSPRRKRSCILLWMQGGPSQTDTFDMKPGHANGGPFKEIATTVPGLRFSEHMPQLAKQAKHLALVRSMSSKVGDHSQAAYYLGTGYLQQGPVQYPCLGSLLSKELGNVQSSLPGFVSVAPVMSPSRDALTPGFLGPAYAPLVVGKQGGSLVPDANEPFRVQDLRPPQGIQPSRADARIGLLQDLRGDFVARHPGVPVLSQRSAYERAVRLMRTSAGRAFDLHEEPSQLRDRYGRHLFGQGCLLARRLVERGVPFVEVTLWDRSILIDADGSWDTHEQNFDRVRRLCGVLDPAWATLLEDLDQRGLLDTTLVVWMGEFGRTPKLNGRSGGGRDHFPDAWSTVLCGGGIKGGTVYGQTSPDGMAIKEHPVSVPDLLATIAKAVGIDPTKQNMSNVGRPIRIADAGSKPIKDLLA